MNRLLTIALLAGCLQARTAFAQAGPATTQIDPSQVRGLAPSATTDATYAANISTGTLPNARLSAVPNSALANSSITVNAGPGLDTTSPSLSLGASTTVTRSITINSQTGTSYTVSNADQAKLVIFNNTNAVTVTLPQAGAAGQFAAKWFADFQNLGNGTVTIRPITSTINGSSSLALANNQGLRIVSDGSNYQIFALHTTNLAGAGPGGVTGLLPVAYVDGLAPSAITDATNASNISTGTLPNARLASVPNSALANSSLTLNAGAGLSTTSSSLSLGGSTTIARSVAINSQTGTSYTVSNTDQGKLVTFNNSASVEVALPQAGAAGQFAANWFADFQNLGNGTVAIMPITSTINSNSSLALVKNQGVRVISDGSNYQIFALHTTNLAAGGPGGVTGLLSASNVSGLAPSATTDATNATNISSGTLSAARLPGLTGDVSSPAGSLATVLASVNSGPGTCGDAVHVCQLTTNAKGLVTSQSPVAISASGSAPAVQVNGTTLGTASTINFSNGSGLTFNGSLSGNTATITGSASSGSGGSVTTGSGGPSSGCSSSSNLGAIYLQTNTFSPTLWICGYNGSNYQWVQIQDNTINVVSLGADPSGLSDSTSAINSATGATCPTACVVYFPPGHYKTSGTINVAKSETTLEGAGAKGVSYIDFEPSAAGTAISVSSSSPSTTDIARVMIRNLGIYSSNTSVTKIALQIVACTSCTFEDIYIWGTGSNTTLSGGGSIGIETHGHDNNTVHDVVIQADEPIHIAANPDTYGGIQLDMDHWHWYNCYLIANGHPNISADSGLVLTDDTWDGLEPWVLGTYGFYWSNSGVSNASYALTFANVRTEQGTCGTCASFYIASSSNQIQGLRILNAYADPNRAGFYLRDTVWTELDGFWYGGSGVVADMNSSNSHPVIRAYFGSGTQASGTSIPVSSGYVNTFTN